MKLYFSSLENADMHQLALFALSAGYTVIGSALTDTPKITNLIERGAQISINPLPEHLVQTLNRSNVDWVVFPDSIGSKKVNDLIKAETYIAAHHDLPIAEWIDVCNEIIRTKKLKVISVISSASETKSNNALRRSLNVADTTKRLFEKFQIPISLLNGVGVESDSESIWNEGSEYLIIPRSLQEEKNYTRLTSLSAILTNIDFEQKDREHSGLLDTLGNFVGTVSDSVFCWNDDFEKIKDNLPMASYVKNPRPYIVDANETDPQTKAILSSFNNENHELSKDLFLVLALGISLLEVDLEDIVEFLKTIK